jgi:hypothetical protein
MEILLLIFVVILQNIAVFLDNHAIFYLTSRHNSSKIASAYIKKSQIDFLSRGFLFFTPPLLGLMLTENNLFFLLMSLLLSSFITLILSLIQSFHFLLKMNIRFLLPISKKNFLLLLVGVFVYSLYLYVPFYLNILSYFFKDQSLWIVQMSPALTAISSVFVVYYMDPKVANLIDSFSAEKKFDVVYELIGIRILGRILIFVVSFFLFIKFV